MQPLFSNNPLLLSVLLLSILIWIVIEVTVQIRQSKRFRASVEVGIGQLLCALLASVVPAAAIAGNRGFLFWSGIVLAYVGIALRLCAINVLGASFTTTEAIAPAQSVIEAHPSRFIHQLATLGGIITLLGFGLCYTNWLGLLVLLGSIIVAQLLRRPITIEAQSSLATEHPGAQPSYESGYQGYQPHQPVSAVSRSAPGSRTRPQPHNDRPDAPVYEQTPLQYPEQW